MSRRISPVLAFVLSQIGFAAIFFPGDATAGTSFAIPVADGYGVQECLVEDGECGQILADTWCASHDRGQAISFGVKIDVTGSVAGQKPGTQAEVITCSE